MQCTVLQLDRAVLLDKLFTLSTSFGRQSAKVDFAAYQYDVRTARVDLVFAFVKIAHRRFYGVDR